MVCLMQQISKLIVFSFLKFYTHSDRQKLPLPSSEVNLLYHFREFRWIFVNVREIGTRPRLLLSLAFLYVSLETHILCLHGLTNFSCPRFATAFSFYAEHSLLQVDSITFIFSFRVINKRRFIGNWNPQKQSFSYKNVNSIIDEEFSEAFAQSCSVKRCS